MKLHNKIKLLNNPVLPETKQSKVQSVLKGIIHENTIRNLRPNKKLIVFVSSTFTDTYKERNILQDRISPELRKLGSAKDVQVMFYDMRFGVKDENTLDHTTWQCCQEGIRECRDESDGIFFMSLQGDKYGYRPLPKLIDREYFEPSFAQHAENDRALLEISRRWYHLNENHLVPKYELQNLPSVNDKEYWTVILPRLRDELLNEIPFDGKYPKLLIGRSVTEWEVLFAESIKTGPSVGIWIQKEFNRQSLDNLGSNGRASDFNDGLHDERVTAHLSRLKEDMVRGFEILHPAALQSLSATDYVTDNAACREFLEAWEQTVKTRLHEELNKCVEDHISWTKLSTSQFRLPVEHLEEMLHHCSITHQQATAFLGREELVEKALTMNTTASTKDPSTPYFSAITAAVIGPSGVGKTALMAKLATLVSSQLGGTERGGGGANVPPIITRYCGTSRFSLHGKDLIQSIGLQLLACYNEKRKIPKFLQSMVGQSYEDAMVEFGVLLQHYPVILFLDGVEQLSSKDIAGSKLSFLKNLQMHKQSRIIVSTLPDEYDETNQTRKGRYYCEKIVRDHHIPVVEMQQYQPDEATIRSLLGRLLARRERKITKHQWSVVLKSASHEPTMLYLNLSLEIITKWRSWDREVELRPTVKGVIQQIFEELERHYGQALIRYALGFITFSRDGISDYEITDCLSRQSEVFQEVCQYWQGVRTIPLHVWLRVKQAIKALLAEKDHGCLQWGNRQLWEAAQERYEEVRKDCHRIMGRYFTEQSLCLTELAVWHPESKVNRRRVREGYYHFYESGLYEEAITEMCSFEMVCASALCEDAYHSLRYFSKLHAHQSELKAENERFDHYYRWLRRAISSIILNPRDRISATASEEPILSLVKKENTTRFLENHHRKDSFLLGLSMKTVETLGGRQTFDHVITTLTGHRKNVTSVAWRSDGSQVASGSLDNTLKIWDAATGELLSTLEEFAYFFQVAERSQHNPYVTKMPSGAELMQSFFGYELWVKAIAWNHDGSTLAAGLDDRTVKVWDALTGELITVLAGHTLSLESVAWNPDGSRIASGSKDKTVKVWNASTGELLHTLEGHSDDVTSVAWNPDGSKIASGSVDKTIQIWEASTGQWLQTFDLHGDQATSVAWSPDGSQIASGLWDKTIRIWTVATGEVLQTWRGHKDKVASIAWSSDGSMLASGSWDATVNLWGAATGALLYTSEIHSGQVTSVAWSPDGTKIASGAADQTVKIWEVRIAEHSSSVHEVIGHSKAVTSVAWSGDERKIASGSEDTTIKIWDAATGELLQTLDGHQDSVQSVAWNPDVSKLASGSNDKIIKIWDSSTGELLRTVEGHAGCVRSVAWSPDGYKIASGSDDSSIKIWDPFTGELLNTLEGHRSHVTSVTWNPDGSKITSGSWDNTIKIWDSATGELLRTLEGHSDVVTSVTWSQDGSTIASGSWDQTIKIWNLLTGELFGTLEGNSKVVSSVAFSQDSSKIAAGLGDHTIKVLDKSTGKLNTLEGHSDAVSSVAWNRDGSKLASGSYDKTVKVFHYTG